ncbi:MAG: metal-dependent transcriptional regulator [Arachnia sp.]
MSDLIDTTEMYLRTVYELIEEGVSPLRARIAERLHQSGPTVSQTVSRMERDELLVVEDDRTITLTKHGARLARDVMRKHRLAECLLTEVIGLDWDKVHDEACRWEHVVSAEVERRLVAILESPRFSPYGNPIPGLSELGVDVEYTPFRRGVAPLSSRLTGVETITARLERMSEHAQADPAILEALTKIGLRPGIEFRSHCAGRGVELITDEGGVILDAHVADLLFVAEPDA